MAPATARLGDTGVSALPEYYGMLSGDEKYGVAMGRLRPLPGEAWPKTYAEWVELRHKIWTRREVDR